MLVDQESDRELQGDAELEELLGEEFDGISIRG